MLFYQYPRTASERQTQRHLPNSRRGATESPGGRDLAESWSVNVGRVIGKRRLRDIRAKFGKRVARIVQGCTDSDVTPKPPWLERKKEYLKHLREADSSVRLVSAADKLYNASETLADFRSHRESIWKRFKGGKQGTLWYYREVARILRKNGPKELAKDLDRTVKELSRASRTR